MFITVATFLPALWNGFVEWDDDANLLGNVHFRGLAWTNVRWMVTNVFLGQWIPLTWLSFGLDFTIWGLNPFGYHLTSVVLHAINGLLLFFVGFRILNLAMPGTELHSLRLGAVAAALFFSLHPLRVESVAWATERRDVLSGCFFLLTVLTYLLAHGAGHRRRRWLPISVACYALALGAKSIVVPLPAILLILDVYPLRRLGSPTGRAFNRTRAVLLEKVPYFALAAAGAVMAIYAMHVNGFLTSTARLPWVTRIPVVFYSLWFYPSRTAVPFALAPLHELPAHVDLLEPRFLLTMIGVVGMTSLFVILRRAWPAGLAAWITYAILLAPVSGIAHNGHQLTHDRYSYLSCLPWALLFGAGVAFLVRVEGGGLVRRSVRRLAAGVAALWLLGLATLTVQGVHQWRDTDTLWRFALEAEPDCAICRFNLGSSLAGRGYLDAAIAQIERALALRPDQIRFHGNLGVALAAAGRSSEAAAHFERLLQEYPGDRAMRVNLAQALVESGRVDAGITALDRVIREKPDYVGAYVTLGKVLVDNGRAREADTVITKALALDPNLIGALSARVRVRLALGDQQGANGTYDRLRRLNGVASASISPWLIAQW